MFDNGQQLRTVWVALAVAAFMATEAGAAVRRFVDVRYQREDFTESDPYAMEALFVTGQELNKATKTYDYSGYSKYALIWFDKDEVAIVELDVFMPISDGTFDADDFETAFRFRSELDGNQVNTDSGRPRRWIFQAKRGLKWIDPRIR